MIQATTGRVLVKVVEQEKKSVGGIILAGESNPDNLANKGTIVSSGVSDSQAEVGATVYFNRFSGVNIQGESGKLVSLKLEEIIAIDVNNESTDNV